MKSRRGFTLVEVVVILVVLSVLAAVAIPMAFRIFQVTAEDATREEMDNIKKAMIGNPQKLQSSFRSDFGFLGDIGCMPAVLDRLLTDGGLPTPYTFDSTKQAGA
ncbi:MAG: prepilin-type N-terminal cleavage/methylation domain-containing protein, partial [Deltaproteobacteria bacterium]|nr:prepilin-type N-terminal cleavage/methylation domain-containing protein [Deltaproteobacteria bacterium]